MLEVQLPGQYPALLKDRFIDLFSRTAQYLLTRLLLNPSRHIRRDKLAGLIWPDPTNSTVRGNLRQILWQVREASDTEGEAWLQ